MCDNMKCLPYFMQSNCKCHKVKEKKQMYCVLHRSCEMHSTANTFSIVSKTIKLLNVTNKYRSLTIINKYEDTSVADIS